MGSTLGTMVRGGWFVSLWAHDASVFLCGLLARWKEEVVVVDSVVGMRSAMVCHCSMRYDCGSTWRRWGVRLRLPMVCVCVILLYFVNKWNAMQDFFLYLLMVMGW